MTLLRGREVELARLDELAAAARDGAGGVIVVEGAAGIGKSRLLAEASGRAAAAGLLVAAGGADELDRVTSWGVLLRALSANDAPIMTSADLDSLRDLTDQRLAVAERMRAALEQAAASRPLLMVLDDLQWADPASLLALGSLPAGVVLLPGRVAARAAPAARQPGPGPGAEAPGEGRRRPPAPRAVVSGWRAGTGPGRRPDGYRCGPRHS